MMKFEEVRMTEKEWFQNTKDTATLFGVKFSDIETWIHQAKCKDFDVTDYIHKQRVKATFDRMIAKMKVENSHPVIIAIEGKVELGL